MTEDFMADTLPDNFSVWGPYALAHPEAMQPRTETEFTGYAFTGLVRSTPLGNRFLVAPYQFQIGVCDPRDENPLAPPELRATVDRILVAQRPCETEVAFLQLESPPRFYHQPWMVVASTPDWIHEQLRAIHGESVQIEIVESESIDWQDSNFWHPWFQI